MVSSQRPPPEIRQCGPLACPRGERRVRARLRGHLADDRTDPGWRPLRPVERVIARAPVTFLAGGCRGFAAYLLIVKRVPAREHPTEERRERWCHPWQDFVDRALALGIGSHAVAGGQHLVEPLEAQLLVEEAEADRRVREYG